MSSVDSDEESDCSSTSSRNSEISTRRCLKKFKKKNFSIKEFKIMLVNGLSKAHKDAYLTPELNKDGRFSAAGDSPSADPVETSVDDNSLANNGPLCSNGNEIGDVTTEVEFEIEDDDDSIDENSSIDENNFELRIDNDDDEAETSVTKLNSKLDDDEDTKDWEALSPSENNVREERLLQPSLQRVKKVPLRSYLSTDLENIAIPDTMTAATSNFSSKTNGSLASPSPLVESNCAFCEKHFPTKSSLKFHVRFHLKSFRKKDVKDDFLAKISEMDNTAVENDDSNRYSDLECVFCEESLPNKKSLIVHYMVHHPADSPKSSISNQNRMPASSTSTVKKVRRRSSEGKIMDAAVPSPGIISDTEENCENVKVDESGKYDDASRQYKCYICDKLFARHSSLMWHIQFHETHMSSKTKKNNAESENGLSPGGTGGEPFPVDPDHPYRCQVCGKTYESVVPFRRHVANHGTTNVEETGEKCELCNKYCPTAVGLKRHILFMHKEKYPAPAVEDANDVSSVDLPEEADSVSGSSVGDEFVCNLCDRPFNHRSSFKRHLGAVHKMSGDELTSLFVQQTSVKRKSCNKIFSSSSVFKNHAKKCKVATTTPDAVVEDELQAELSEPVTSYRTTSEPITYDCYVEREEGDFQCTVCDKIFPKLRGVKRHLYFHKIGSNISVGTGGTSLNVASDEDVDKNDNFDMDKDDDAEEETSKTCSVCGKTFASARGMKIHANSHRLTVKNTEDDNGDDYSEDVSESSYDCNVCSESFDGRREYKAHVAWHKRHGDDLAMPRRKRVKSVPAPIPVPPGSARIHECQFCPRWYTTQQALAGHMKAHQPQKSGSPQKSDPARPSASGGGKTAKAYTCSVCGLPFPNNSSLNNHMRVHIGEGTMIPTTSSGQPLTLEDMMECDICGLCFMHKQGMAKHMRDHMSGALTKEDVDLSLFRCIHCRKSFVGRRSLMTHEMLHEVAQIAVKRAADRMPSGAPTAKQPRHSESAASVQDDMIGWDEMMRSHQCNQCDRRLSTKQSLRRHMLWHERMDAPGASSAPPTNETEPTTMPPPPPSEVAEATSFECLYCRKCFRSKELLIDHTKIHEVTPDDGPPTVVVNDVEALGDHVVVQCLEGGREEYFVFEERVSESFQCSECDETHFNKLQMMVHMAYHVGKRWANGHQKALVVKVDPTLLAPFECMFCEERFVNKTFRSRHLQKRHGDDVLHCGSCKKLFLNKKKLAEHCQRHSSDSLYRCQHCLKCFTSRWFLKRHTRKNCANKSSPDRNEENFLTPSLKCSPSAQVLQEHKCEFCGLLVNNKQAFLGHLQSHVLKYKCENCDFGCENILELESHACIVTTTESIACTQCDSFFTDGAELEAHRQTCHGGTLLCDMCSELFTDESDLQSHRRKNHLSGRDVG